jgi:hypothetical protein
VILLAVKIKIPISFQRYTNRKEYVYATSGRLEEILEELKYKYPILGDNLFDGKGNLKSYIKFLILISEDMVGNISTKPKEFLKSNDKIKDGQVIKIMLPIAGG